MIVWDNKQSESLRAFGEQMHNLLIQAHPALGEETARPICGKTYELFLLRGDLLLSSPGDSLGDVSGKEAAQGLKLSDTAAEQLRRYLAQPTRCCLALLNTEGRLLIVFPLPSMDQGEAVAILPASDAASLARVLLHSFESQVCWSEEALALARGKGNSADEPTFMYLRTLMRLWQWLCRAKDEHLEDRRELSAHMLQTAVWMRTLMGEERDSTDDIFPLPYPFVGTYRAVPAAWMMLCLGCGLHRCFSRVLETLRFVPDHECLLPMIEIRAGNRTVIPAEWRECERLAAKEGLYFEVKRAKGVIRVAFCPMTPDISPTLFYSLRAPQTTLWQLRAALKDGFKF
jgi:hypothetical protein